MNGWIETEGEIERKKGRRFKRKRWMDDGGEWIFPI